MRGRLARALAVMLTLALWCASGPESRAAAETEAARDITSKCTFQVSEGSKKKLTDGSEKSTWTYEKIGAYAGFKLPEGVTPGRMIVEWMFDPTGVSIEEYDASQNLIRTRDQSCTFPNIVSDYPLLENTRYVVLRMTAMDQEVGEIHVYSAGELPSKVQIWDPPCEKAALMVVSAHQDDELIFFGGTIPYYGVARGYPTQVVYMANCTRHRRYEALAGLWVMGIRNYPDFINLPDGHSNSLAEGAQKWGGTEHVLGLLVERIRRYKPEVIVTHDVNGEYGHDQHQLTCRAVTKAVELASDPNQYPDSARKYGAWQVKKLYLHLYKENEIMMDWNQPLEAFNGKTALQAAQYGYAQHVSQQEYYQVVDHGKYDNAKFGLAFTTVGVDEAKNDMFEYIDLSAAGLTAFATAQAASEEPAQEEVLLVEGSLEAEGGEPETLEGESGSDGAEPESAAAQTVEDEAAVIESEPEPTPTPEPVPTEAPAAEPATTAERSGGGWLLPTALAVVGLGGAGGVIAFSNARMRRKSHRRRRRVRR